MDKLNSPPRRPLTHALRAPREAAEKKLFAGARLRRLRVQLGLSQTRMAEELGVSISYLNLIERNQRPLTAQFVLRLAEVFDVDVRQLTGDSADSTLAELAEALGDGLFRNLSVPRSEIEDLAQLCPTVASALLRLYSAYRERRAGAPDESARGDDREAAGPGPLEAVRDLIQDNRNHFMEIDARAEAISEELRLESEDLFNALKERMRARHQQVVRLLPLDVMPESLRRYDLHRRQLFLSELLDAPGKLFQTAHHLGLVECRAEIDRVVQAAKLEDEQAGRLLRVNLANYFAAAIMMPYGRFLQAAESVGYDLELLAARFGASFEQVAHRLTTLQRPNARGIPFFLIRVDQAGNISKRFSATRFHFSKYGGTCPLWCVHTCFRQPGKVLTQIVEMPDGTRYFTIARTVRNGWTPWGSVEPTFAIGLGCEIKYAHALVYTQGLDLANPQATPIGPNCSLCDRANCRQRSQPPAGRPLIVDERVRGPAPFTFTGA
jgi:XRE family transcriptional regulator, fatty acid utilization regulator